MVTSQKYEIAPLFFMHAARSDLLCIAPEEPYRLERLLAFLQLNGFDRKLIVLALPTQSEPVRQTVRQFTVLTVEVVPFPEAAVPGYFSPAGITPELAARFTGGAVQGVVLLGGEPSRFRYMPCFFSPPLKPIYNQFRLLHRLGVHTVFLFHLNGLYQVEIPTLLDDFVDRHKGRRCFVVGNGPSLRMVDVRKLRHEIAFGSNRCYLGFEDWGFSFPYWCIVDSLQIEKYMAEWETNLSDEIVKFFPFEYLNLFNFKNFCPVNFYATGRPENRTNFSDPNLAEYLQACPNFSNIPDVIFLGHTVTYAMIQIAVVMGCNPIVLIGVDNKYSLAKVNKTEGTWSSNEAMNHFHPDYSKGKYFHLPDQEQSEIFFNYSAGWADNHGVEIINASPVSELKCFRMVKFDELF